jgi:membrane protein
VRRHLTATGKVLGQASRNFHRDNCLDLSATVAYYTLLSLGPSLYLLGATLRFTLDADDALESALTRIAAFLPPEAVSLLRAVVASLRQDEPLIWLAVPGLIWVAMSAFSALEYAINVASGTAPLRKFWHSRLKALLVLAGGWLLLGASLVAGSLMPRLEALREQLGLPGGALEKHALATYPFQLLATFLVFAAFYKLLPRGTVAWGSAARGAAVALGLWECARRLFTMVLARSPAFGLVTGTVAGVVAFLAWIYTAVAVVLLGAELSAVLNGNRAPDGS